MTLSPRSWSPFFWRTYMGHKGISIKVVFSSLKHTQDQITKTFKCDGCNKFCVDLSIVTMIWELDSVTNSQRPVKHHGCWEANSHRQFFWSFKSVGINMTALFSKFSLLRQTCSSVYTQGMVIILYSIMLNEKSFMLLMSHCGGKPFRSQITRGTDPQAVFYPLWRST